MSQPAPGAGPDGVTPEQRYPGRSADPDAGAAPAEPVGVDPAGLDDGDLLRELRSLHRTRLDTLRHAADTALATHLSRTAELETEYLARYPDREVDPARLRDGD